MELLGHGICTCSVLPATPHPTPQGCSLSFPSASIPDTHVWSPRDCAWPSVWGVLEVGVWALSLTPYGALKLVHCEETKTSQVVCRRSSDPHLQISLLKKSVRKLYAKEKTPFTKLELKDLRTTVMANTYGRRPLCLTATMYSTSFGLQWDEVLSACNKKSDFIFFCLFCCWWFSSPQESLGAPSLAPVGSSSHPSPGPLAGPSP